MHLIMSLLSKIFSGLLIFIILSLVTSYVTFRLFTYSKSTEAPDLIGKSLLEANELLGDSRLYLKIEGKVYDSVIPSGRIVTQSLPAGKKSREGRTIRVVLSKGPLIRYMPEFTGISLKEAEEMALNNNINIKKIISVHTYGFDKDVVISQKPGPEEKGGGDLVLIVSSGTYETSYYCPDFSGMSINNAREIAQSLAIELDSTGVGTIVESQTPEAGSLIDKGDIVHIKVRAQKNKIFEEEQIDRWSL